MHDNTLREIQSSLCHPGITRLHHFVKVKNLPHFIDDVSKVVNQCNICAEIKPTLYKPPLAHLAFLLLAPTLMLKLLKTV